MTRVGEPTGIVPTDQGGVPDVPPPPYPGGGAPLQPYPPGATGYAYTVQPQGVPTTYSTVPTGQPPVVVPVIDDGSGDYPVVIDIGRLPHHHHHYGNYGDYGEGRMGPHRSNEGAALQELVKLDVEMAEGVLKGAEIAVTDGAKVAAEVGKFVLEETENVGGCLSCLGSCGSFLCGAWECLKGLASCLCCLLQCLLQAEEKR
jgi:hypothetical protein